MSEIKFKLSVVKDNDKTINKKIGLKKDGSLRKEASASITNGQAITIQLTLEDLVELLNGLESNQAITLGHNRNTKLGERYDLVVKAKDSPEENKYGRSLDNFGWESKYQLVMFDYDGGASGSDQMTVDEFVGVIDKVLPGFAKVKKVVKYSTGAHIYDSDRKMTKHDGFYLYFLVNKPDRIKQIFGEIKGHLNVNLWLNGYGFIKNSRPTDPKTTMISQLSRNIYDLSVFSPERLCFEAKSDLSDGLVQKESDARLIDGENDYLDITGFVTPSTQKINKYQRVVDDAKKGNAESSYYKECEAAFEGNVRLNFANQVYKDDVTLQGKDVEQVVETLKKRSMEGILYYDHKIKLQNGTEVSVKDILEHPIDYHEMNCFDPVEWDYEARGNVARIYCNVNNGKPFIKSFAHSGRQYLLGVDADEVDKAREAREFVKSIAFDRKNGKFIEIETGALIGGYKHLDIAYGHLTLDGYKPSEYYTRDAGKTVVNGSVWEPEDVKFLEHYDGMYYNTYRREKVEKVNEEKLLAAWEYLAEYILGEYKDLVLDHMAYTLQFPERKIRWQVVVVGSPRTGKTMVFKPMIEALGVNAGTVGAEEMKTGWGDFFINRKAILIEELFAYDRGMFNKMKTKFANDDYETLNPKGRTTIVQHNLYSIYMLSNHLDALQMDENEDKLLVIRAPDERLSGKYEFLYDLIGENMEQVSKAVYWYLMERDVSKFKAGHLPVRTQAMMDMCKESEPEEHRYIRSILDGFQGAIVLEELRDHLRAKGYKHHSSSISAILRKMGWADHRFQKKANGIVASWRLWTNVKGFADMDVKKRLELVGKRKRFEGLFSHY